MLTEPESCPSQELLDSNSYHSINESIYYSQEANEYLENWMDEDCIETGSQTSVFEYITDSSPTTMDTSILSSCENSQSPRSSSDMLFRDGEEEGDKDEFDLLWDS